MTVGMTISCLWQRFLFPQGKLSRAANKEDGVLSMFDSREFRSTVGQFATGVTVLGLTTANGVHGMTANSFTSVSLDPPLILVCVDKKNTTHRLIGEIKDFTVNILSSDQEEIARLYAGQQVESARPEWRLDVADAPVLKGVLAWLDCTLEHAYDGGDHTIYVARVKKLSSSGGNPLIFFRGRFTSLTVDG